MTENTEESFLAFLGLGGGAFMYSMCVCGWYLCICALVCVCVAGQVNSSYLIQKSPPCPALDLLFIMENKSYSL